MLYFTFNISSANYDRNFTMWLKFFHNTDATEVTPYTETIKTNQQGMLVYLIAYIYDNENNKEKIIFLPKLKTLSWSKHKIEDFDRRRKI